MKIVIIGLGRIGSTVLKSLSDEGHTLTIIDEDRELIESLIERYDVFGVAGNGACMDIQMEANVSDADLVIALTKNDELNIFACLVAKRLGVSSTVARVRNPACRKQIIDMKDALGISMIVNPEMDMANEIYHLISLPSAVRVERFAKGRALLVEVVAEAGCPLIGESLITLGKKMNSKFLICAVQRGEDVFIPSGHFVIQENDRIHFTSDSRNLINFLSEAKLVKSTLRSVMIISGGKVGCYLADALSQKKYSVKHGFFSNFSAAVACLSNVGPGFEAIGPYSSYAGYGTFSTIVLTFAMLLGRLEILPVLILLSRRTWKKI